MNENLIDNQEQLDDDKALLQQLLDTYFQFRAPLPQTGYIKDPKTTQQIQDELDTMYPVDTRDIAAYMLHEGYSMMTEGNGQVSWAIWRMP